MKTIKLFVLNLTLAAMAVVSASAGATTESSSASSPSRGISTRPNVLVITVDTLRADRMSSYGYERRTTPELDQLIAQGAKFTQARTVEPLTSPALSSMMTSLYPHHHGATRNGLRMRSGLASLPKSLQAWGYRTGAFVGNWTLRDKLSGMAEHFEVYEEVLTRRRWFGLVRSEASAHDITGQALDWITEHSRTQRDTPFFTWVHYTEPHGPYRLHRDFLPALKIASDDLTASDRYDTEVAFVDASIGRLLRGVRNLSLKGETLIIFTADHGESLGEHGYWGHGRHLYEPTLRIPLALVWPGRIEPQEVEAPALIIDIASTVLSLLDRTAPAGFEGFDWTPVLNGTAEPPLDRITRYQAHRGAVISRHDSELARRSGLLELGLIHNNRKEIFRVAKNRSRRFDLDADPLELNDLGAAAPSTTPPGKSDPSEGLMGWMKTVYDGLTAFSDSPPEPLDEESIEQLRSLGYVD